MSQAATPVAPPSPGTVRLVNAIDRFTDTTGGWFAWIMVPLTLTVAYEVFARYFFNAPTIWAYDIIYMLYGSVFMLGSAYALHKGAHIRTDFLWDKFSIRKKGMIDTIAYIVFFFPALTVFMYVSGAEALYSISINETSESTSWKPVLWPLKTVVPVTCLLLLIQGVSETIKSLYAWRTGIEMEHKEKIEI